MKVKKKGSKRERKLGLNIYKMIKYSKYALHNVPAAAVVAAAEGFLG